MTGTQCPSQHLQSVLWPRLGPQHQARVTHTWIPALPLASCETSGNFLSLSELGLSQVGAGITTDWDVVRSGWEAVLKGVCPATAPVVTSDVSRLSGQSQLPRRSRPRRLGWARGPGSLARAVVPDSHSAVLSSRLPVGVGEALLASTFWGGNSVRDSSARSAPERPVQMSSAALFPTGTNLKSTLFL